MAKTALKTGANSQAPDAAGSTLPTADASRSALEFLQDLVLSPTWLDASLAYILRGLAESFRAVGAGFATLVPEGFAEQLLVRGTPDNSADPAARPWYGAIDSVERLRAAPCVRTILLPGRASFLAVRYLSSSNAPNTGGILWLEGSDTRVWSNAESAALVVASRLLINRLGAGTDTVTAAVADRHRLQRRLSKRLEIAAALAKQVSHDFGNIVTSIHGFAELALMQTPPKTTSHRYLTQLYQATLEARQLLTLLDLFAPRPPAHSSSARSLPLTLLVGELQAYLDRFFKPGSLGRLTLELDAAADLPPVAIDVETLRGLLLQLTANAREAMPNGGQVTLSVRRRELSSVHCREVIGPALPGSYVELALADGGPGLSPDTRRRLFDDLFFSTKPRRRGLGLTIVYAIVQAHAGGLRIDSLGERGTLVRVWLPAGRVERAAPATANATTTTLASSTTRSGNGSTDTSKPARSSPQ